MIKCKHKCFKINFKGRNKVKIKNKLSYFFMAFGAYSIIALSFGGNAFAVDASNFTKALEDKGLLNITSSETIDKEISVVRGKIDNLNFTTISWNKNGSYKLQKGITQGEINKTFTPWNKDNILNEAKLHKTPVIFTGGFWQLENADGAWSQRELGLGKNGIMYSDGKGNVEVSNLDNSEVSKIFQKMGDKGWNVGAFSPIVKNGVIDSTLGQNGVWHGDPNVKNARTIFVELNNGLQSVIVVDGHTSTKTGLDHNEIVNIINQIGVPSIKNAFMLDGGGSTRAYTKSDNGTETLMGSFVDNRFASQFLYLSKNEVKPEFSVDRNNDKVAKNESQTVTYADWKAAFDKGLKFIPGTQYPTGVLETAAPINNVNNLQAATPAAQQNAVENKANESAKNKAIKVPNTGSKTTTNHQTTFLWVASAIIAAILTGFITLKGLKSYKVRIQK